MRGWLATTARAGAVLTVGLALAACSDGYGDDSGDDDGSGASDGDTTVVSSASLVGQVEGGDAFVAIVASDDGEVIAYVCDAEEGEAATTSEWFTGELDGTELLLESDSGATLEAALADAGASGTFTTADGEASSLTAVPAEGEAGLYRGEDGDALAGFIVDNDGDDRGGFGMGGIMQVRSAFNPANPVLLLPSRGELRLTLVSP